MKPVVEGMGLAWHGQYERIKRNETLAKGIREMRMPSVGDAVGAERRFALIEVSATVAETLSPAESFRHRGKNPRPSTTRTPPNAPRLRRGAIEWGRAPYGWRKRDRTHQRASHGLSRVAIVRTDPDPTRGRLGTAPTRRGAIPESRADLGRVGRMAGRGSPAFRIARTGHAGPA